MDWKETAERVLGEVALKKSEALAVLRSSDDELLALLQAAFEVRRRYFGRGVNVHVLMNAKSGLCSEDCGFCSQSASAKSGVDRYPLRSADVLVEGARQAHKLGAVKYCMVASAKSPTAREMETVCEAVRRIKADLPLKVCTSLGMLTAVQARQLAKAGVDRYNHNLETSKRYFPTICHTHAYGDRVATVRAAKAAGMEACCGGIVGMGETLEDRVEWAFALRDLQVDAIPVNFFDPRPGTPMEHLPRPTPADGLRALAMVRLANPTRDIRAAGGREACLRHLQPLALYAANSLFTKGYLTTSGQGYETDRAMIEEAGFSVATLEA
ncbi:MAG: biotin synthase BioB [Verrucomicrobiota bacterium]